MSVPSCLGAVAVVSRRLLFRAAALAIGATLLLPALAPAWISGASPAWAADRLVITSDNSGGSLVSASNLAPGDQPPTCLTIFYAGAGARDKLQLIVTTDNSALTNYIGVSIEQGHGGRHGDCSGFTGTSVYEGTLASAGQQHGSELSAMEIIGLTEGSGEVSLRLTFAVGNDNRAQGGSTRSDFTWIAGSPPPAVNVPPGGTPGGAPGQTPRSQPKPAIKMPVVGPPALPGTLPKPGAEPQSDGERHQASKSGTRALAESAAQAIAAQVRRIGKPLLKGAAFGLGTLPLVILFLLIQHYIDRRDPKLANAPSYAEPDLPFGNMPHRADA